MRPPKRKSRTAFWRFLFALAAAAFASGRAAGQTAQSRSSPLPSDPAPPDGSIETNSVPAFENWNWHAQNTDIVQGYPGFPARYSGPNSLPSGGEIRETVSLDLYTGVRLWPGAEAHLDGIMWQGFGVGRTLGIEGFPNGEAFRVGTGEPNLNLARVFFRQTFGLGGERESIEGDALHLAGEQDISRITITLGRFAAKDLFDNNAYANDPRTQFMNWGLMANEPWDYPADSLGYTTGFAIDFNQRNWALRYGMFQVPRESNGTAMDGHILDAWGMVAELERRYSLGEHHGAVRLLAFLNRAHMGSYEEAVESPVRPADIVDTRAYRYKYGFGLNAEQKLVKDLGAFLRLGWSDGDNEAWNFSDVDRAASAGLSLRGAGWNRPNDTVALGGILNAISKIHQEFLEAGGTGILAGDGALNYGWEEILETYYDAQVWRSLHFTLDYQFINNPAFNRARGPVSVFGARVHWEF